MSVSEAPPVLEDDVSNEDRIRWLRDRGVVIEFPEVRNNIKAESSSASSPSTSKDDGMEEVTLVKIPCELSEPYSEVKVSIPKTSKDKDFFLEALRPYFSPVTSGLDELSLKETASKSLSLSGQALPELSLSSLSKLGGDQQGSVEAFPLSHASEPNNYHNINLYLDEVGQLKHLPRNERAVQLAATCGFENVPLVGDMFIGRLKRYRGIQHLDFTIKDMSSDAAWLKRVKEENFQHGLRTNRVAMEGDLKHEEGKVHHEMDKGYSWSETEESLEVVLRLPEGVSHKMIKVDFHSRRVTVRNKNEASGSQLLLDLQLYKSINADDSTWTGNASEIELSMEKALAGIWGSLGQ
jgi:HSP20 family molecular chaperone IbpA